MPKKAHVKVLRVVSKRSLFGPLRLLRGRLARHVYII